MGDVSCAHKPIEYNHKVKMRSALDEYKLYLHLRN